jgi:hypothetical protein
VGAAGFASFVAPGFFAYAETLVFFYALAADIAVVFSEFLKEGFCIVQGFLLRGHEVSFESKNTRRTL